MTLEHQRPQLTQDEARQLARRLYGITGTVTALPSERDQNFRLRTNIGTTFVLKISGADEPPEHLALQNAALVWLNERNPDLRVPQIAKTLAGEYATTIEGVGGLPHTVRLLTHLSGVPLAQARPHSAALLYDLGYQLGEMDQALQGFTHPAARRDFVWDSTAAPHTIRAHFDAIDDTDRRALLERILLLWEDHVAPQLAGLRRSVTYNDANDYNVLVAEAGAEPRSVTGFVDFGDMVECPTVCDPAIAIAYAMLGKSNPVAAAAHVISGYHRAFPLTEAELEVVFPLALVRLAVSVSVAARRRVEEPADDYLLISEQPAWQALATLCGVHPRFVRAVLRDACGFAPCPSSPGVVAWLEARHGEFAPVVDPDPNGARTTIVDLSVGNAEITAAEELAGTRRFSDLVFGLMKSRRAEVGIGRYDEPRFVYTSEAFAGPDNELPERRTVHLGVDLFLKAGAPVHAPLDGRVHSVRDNAQKLDYGPTVILEHEPTGKPRFYTLYGHLAKDCLTALEPGATVRQGEAFAQIGAFRVNGNWPPHLHFQIVTDLLDRDGEFPGVAAPSERSVWLSLSPDPNLILGLDAATRAVPSMSRAAVQDARSRHIGFNLSLSYREPLSIVRGRGQFLYDEVGHAYLDCVNNVAHVGHAHPRVVDALARQSAVLNTNTRYLHDHIVRYAERLRAKLPPSLSVCYFVNSGSEANDLALRMARAHTGGEHLVVVAGAYHGHTVALIDASPYKHDGPGGRGAPPHVLAVVMPDDYRGPHRRDDAECGTKYAQPVAKAFAEISDDGTTPAAFISETLLSCGGQIELPPQYLAESYAHARAAGAVCIADEVQVGFGRVGTHFWGFETQDVVPDIVTMGKPIGNGHPLAAVVTTPEIARSFDNGMEYFNTYGGNPVSCAVGLAVLNVIEEEQLQDHALTVGTRLKQGLGNLMRSHPSVGDVRGRGLFLGVELVHDRHRRDPAAEKARYVIERAKDHGVLLSTDGPDRNVIKIKPPLVFTSEDADRLVAVLDKVLGEDFVSQPHT